LIEDSQELAKLRKDNGGAGTAPLR
jgi:hypothetical protein